MAEVTDITKQISDRLMLERFARLMRLVEKSEADLLANPKSFLMAAVQRMGAYERRLEKLREAAHGPGMTARPSKLGDMIVDRRLEAIEQLQAVRHLLSMPIE